MSALEVTGTRFDLNKIHLLSQHYHSLMGEQKIFGGGFSLFRYDELIHQEVFGNISASQDETKRYTSDSIRRVESISKVFTATAIMILLEDGKLFLDQPAADFIDEFDNEHHRDITLFHLLTHTSGLLSDPGYFNEANPYQVFDGIHSNPHWMKVFLSGPLQSAPGTQAGYCTIGFMFLAEIIQRVSGMSYGKFIEQRLTAPLGMHNTFVAVPESKYADTVKIFDWDEGLLKHSTHAPSDSMPNGGGGIYSSLNDLMIFCRLFLNGGTLAGTRVLSPRSVDLMVNNRLNDVFAYRWGNKVKNYQQGLAWWRFQQNGLASKNVYGHEGSAWQFMLIEPTEKFIMIQLLNSASDWSPELMVTPRELAFSGLL